MLKNFEEELEKYGDVIENAYMSNESINELKEGIKYYLEECQSIDFIFDYLKKNENWCKIRSLDKIKTEHTSKGIVLSSKTANIFNYILMLEEKIIN